MDIAELRKERPNLQQIRSYQQTPQYIEHKADEDKFAILVCQIKIWKCSGTAWFSVPSAGACLTLRECESIKATKSTKELISKATVKFPRGTVIEKSSKLSKKTKVGELDDNTRTTPELEDATNKGDVIFPQTSQYDEDGVSVTSMDAHHDIKGIIECGGASSEVALLSPNDVAIDNRIEIRCGYAYSEKEFKEMNQTDHQDDSKGMTLVFTGFITGVSVGTPLELECTNMAAVLQRVSMPNVKETTFLPVKDYLSSKGKYNILENTGIGLYPRMDELEVPVTGYSINESLSIADALMDWGSKSHVLAMMVDYQNGQSVLKVGREYYVGGGSLPNDAKEYITYNGGDPTVKILQFDWDVSEDRLEMTRVDKKCLAVEAEGLTKAGEIFKVTVKKVADANDMGWTASQGDFETVNIKETEARKKSKWVHGTYTDRKISGKVKNPMKLRKYNKIVYRSPNIGITDKQLIEEAKQYWALYDQNGISGSVEIFGDVLVEPGEVVGLVDTRQPEKNGYYYVEEVSTSFGINGYRRELKIPFKVTTYGQMIKVI